MSDTTRADAGVRWEAVTVVARGLGLTSRERVLLSEYARRDGGAPSHCFASQTTLAQALGWHRPKMSEVMGELVRKGAVEVVGQRRRYKVVRFPWWRFTEEGDARDLYGNRDTSVQVCEPARGLDLYGFPDSHLHGFPDTEQEENRKGTEGARVRAPPAPAGGDRVTTAKLTDDKLDPKTLLRESADARAIFTAGIRAGRRQERKKVAGLLDEQRALAYLHGIARGRAQAREADDDRTSAAEDAALALTAPELGRPEPRPVVELLNAAEAAGTAWNVMVLGAVLVER